jgi:HK97 family phage portal protein
MAKAKGKKSKEVKDSLAYGVLNSFFGNPVINTKDGRKKPSPWPARELRSLALNNNIVRICINFIKHAVVKTKYIIRPKNKEGEGKYGKEIEYIEKLLQYPNDNDDTARTLLSQILEDILVLDMGVMEKVRNTDGYVIELHSVDGSTIRPNLDEYGLFGDMAYYQYLDMGASKPTAEFSKDDLLVFQVNPQVANGYRGYGLSPVEAVIHTVTTQLLAMQYNATYFDETRLPAYLANLKNVPVEHIKKFKEEFDAQLLNKNWAGAWTNAEALDFKLLRPSNTDMQFNELNTWLARVIFGAFEVSPQSLGFTMDMNRATAEVQDRNTKESGIANILDVIAEEINNDILGDLAMYNRNFEGIEFAWDIQNKLDERMQADVDKIYLEANVIDGNEVRSRMGLEPVDFAAHKDEKPVDETVPMEKNPFEMVAEKTFKQRQIESWENW